MSECILEAGRCVHLAHDHDADLVDDPHFARWLRLEMARLAALAFDATAVRHEASRLVFRAERRLVENRIVEAMERLVVNVLQHGGKI